MKRRKTYENERSPSEDYWKMVGSPVTLISTLVLFIALITCVISLFGIGSDRFQERLYMCIMVVLAMITIVFGAAVKDIGRSQAKIRDDIQVHNKAITSILIDMARDNKRNIGIMDDIRSKVSAEQEEYITPMNIAEMLVPELSPDFLRQYANDYPECETEDIPGQMEETAEGDAESVREDGE